MTSLRPRLHPREPVIAGRRSARPVRLVLPRHPDAGIDGAWWPHTGSLAGELPDLVAILQQPLGEIIDICVNWSETEGQIDLDAMAAGRRWTTDTHLRLPRLMRVTGRDGGAKLLVVPCRTSPALGSMVMRCASALPIDDAVRRTPLYETAENILRLSQDEAAKWV